MRKTKIHDSTVLIENSHQIPGVPSYTTGIQEYPVCQPESRIHPSRIQEYPSTAILIISHGGGDSAGGGGMTMDESEDSRVASSPDPAAKLISMPAAAIFPGDDAGMGDPSCSFEPTKQDSQM